MTQQSRNDAGAKIPWRGVLHSVQPRIRLTRSFDQRSHTYLGYALKVRGNIGNKAREFLVGVGQGAHTKHQFRAGSAVSGDALLVPDARLETVEFLELTRFGGVCLAGTARRRADAENTPRNRVNSNQALGRRAIHPRVMLGLIVYGIINGQWTLRGLERLARVDLGAMWLAGRLQPDHSTIGKFISLHREVLSEDFFDGLLKFLVTRLHLIREIDRETGS